MTTTNEAIKNATAAHDREDPQAMKSKERQSITGQPPIAGIGFDQLAEAATPAAPTQRSVIHFGILVSVGALVSLSLGTYARIHSPTGQGIFAFGFPAVLPMKAWFTSGAAALAIGQLLSALWMWDRLPWVGTASSWTAPAHRWLGTLAFVLTIPVAYHCLWALGFQQTTTRVLIHSLLGCAFYGAFVTKMLALRSNRIPGWALPATGGLLVALLTGIWFSSSLWFFTTIGFPGV